MEADEETDEDLRLLLAPGSSLGGARPKASVRDVDGHLGIAKFPAKDDEINVVRWEAVALSLAGRAGIPVPTWRLESVAGQDVLIVRRFDRSAGAPGPHRVPFLSAMSMLGAADWETHSYLKIADALRAHGAAAATDLADLWRRIVYGVLISNTDEHLRNHGFVYAGTTGWRLAPAYDLNPVPADVSGRMLSTTIGFDDDPTASLALAREVAREFGLKARAADAVIGEVGRVVEGWRDEAARIGLGAAACERMASAFEHDDLRDALRA